MHIAVMLPFDISLIGDFPAEVTSITKTFARAALMASVQFNNRQGSVVPELEQRLRSCNMRMTLDFHDTKLSPIEAARVLDQYVHKQEFPYKATAVVGAALSSVSSTMNYENPSSEKIENCKISWLQATKSGNKN